MQMNVPYDTAPRGVHGACLLWRSGSIWLDFNGVLKLNQADTGLWTLDYRCIIANNIHDYILSLYLCPYPTTENSCDRRTSERIGRYYTIKDLFKLATIFISYFFFSLFLNCIPCSCLELGRSVLYANLSGPTTCRLHCKTIFNRRTLDLIGKW
jgi:hypothetical protein